jgi:hypothetical protein
VPRHFVLGIRGLWLVGECPGPCQGDEQKGTDETHEPRAVQSAIRLNLKKARRDRLDL